MNKQIEQDRLDRERQLDWEQEQQERKLESAREEAQEQQELREYINEQTEGAYYDHT